MQKVVNDFLAAQRYPSQKDFVFTDVRYALQQGGVGSGKTDSLIDRSLFLSIFIPDNQGVIGRYTAAELRDTTEAQFFEKIAQHNLGDLIQSISKTEKKITIRTYDRTAKKPRPSTVYFRHIFEPRPEKKHLAGLNLGWFAGDQIEDWEPQQWNDLMSRLRRVNTKHYGFGVANPKGHWWGWKKWIKPAQDAGLNAEIELNSGLPGTLGFWTQQVPGNRGTDTERTICRSGQDLIAFLTKSDENLSLPAGYIDDLIRNNPPEWVERFVLGSNDEWSGRVYKEFKGLNSVHVIDDFKVPPHWETIVSMDAGGDDPWAINVGRIDPEGDVFLTNEFHEATTVLKNIADWLKNPAYSGIPDYKGNVSFYCDPENKQAINELNYTYGIPVGSAPKGPILPGIFRVSGYLHRHKGRTKTIPGQNYKHELAQDRGTIDISDAPYCWIFRSLHHTIRELEEYHWDRDRTTGESKEKPVDKDNHHPDAIRYLLKLRPEIKEVIESDPRMQRLKRDDYLSYREALRVAEIFAQKQVDGVPVDHQRENVNELFTLDAGEEHEREEENEAWYW